MKTLAKAILFSGLLLGTVASGWAQIPPMAPLKWWSTPRVVQQLGLSPDQVSKIDSIWREHRKTLIDLRADHEKLQIDMDELLSKENIDEAAVVTKVEQLFRAKGQIEKVQMTMRLRIRNVLNRQQQERSLELWKQLRDERNADETGPGPAARNPMRGRGSARIPPSVPKL